MAVTALICAGGRGGAVATLDIAAFKAAYPAFALLSDPQITEAFSLSTIYLRNDGTGPVSTSALQASLLYMLTAHLAQIMYGTTGSNASGVVGRVSSASEGSVSIGADWPATANNAWFLQTPYGANFWQATAGYRMARYLQGPSRFGTGIGSGYYPGRRY